MGTKKKKPEDKRDDDIKLQPFTQELEVDLTSDELADRARRAAHRLQDHDAMQERHKAEAKQNRAALEEVASEIRTLSRAVREGTEFREVDCERVYNWTLGTVTDRRKDTGAVLSERAMTDAERQKALDFDDGKSGDIDEEFSGEEPSGEDAKETSEGEADDGDPDEDAAQ